MYIIIIIINIIKSGFCNRTAGHMLFDTVPDSCCGNIVTGRKSVRCKLASELNPILS